jgi:hypothetical protein
VHALLHRGITADQGIYQGVVGGARGQIITGCLLVVRRKAAMLKPGGKSDLDHPHRIARQAQLLVLDPVPEEHAIIVYLNSPLTETANPAYNLPQIHVLPQS